MSTAVDQVADSLAATNINSTGENEGLHDNVIKTTNAAQNEAVLASAAEGRRLYIGNLAYATSEGELKDFFKDFSVYVQIPSFCFITFTSLCCAAQHSVVDKLAFALNPEQTLIRPTYIPSTSPTRLG